MVHLKRTQCLPSNSVLGQVLASFTLRGTHQTQLLVIVTISEKANFFCLKAMFYDSILA